MASVAPGTTFRTCESSRNCRPEPLSGVLQVRAPAEYCTRTTVARFPGGTGSPFRGLWGVGRRRPLPFRGALLVPGADGKFVDAASWRSATVTAFRRDPQPGTLAHVQ